MTLQQLRYILELSRHNSISAAAHALNISQPSLSTAIKDLEKEFSLTLVERNRHGITFTPAGLEFLHYAGHILSHAEAMHDHFQAEKKQDLPQVLSISSQHYPFADEAFIHALQHVPPNAACTFTLREGRTSQVIHDVVTRESQLGILFLSHMNARFLKDLFHKNKLEFTPLCPQRPSPGRIFSRRSRPIQQLSLRPLRTRSRQIAVFRRTAPAQPGQPPVHLRHRSVDAVQHHPGHRRLHHRYGSRSPIHHRPPPRSHPHRKSPGHDDRRLDQDGRRTPVRRSFPLHHHPDGLVERTGE